MLTSALVKDCKNELRSPFRSMLRRVFLPSAILVVSMLLGLLGAIVGLASTVGPMGEVKSAVSSFGLLLERIGRTGLVFAVLWFLCSLLLGRGSKRSVNADQESDSGGLPFDVGGSIARPADIILTPFQRRYVTLRRCGMILLLCGLGVFLTAGILAMNSVSVEVAHILMIVIFALTVILPLLLIIGSIAMFRYVWVVLRNDYAVCPSCRYRLQGLPAKGICPECGCGYELSAVRQSWMKTLFGIIETR